MNNFGWIFYSSKHEEEIEGLLADPGTLDELGVRVVQNVFSDYFFPATTTIETRAKYLLLIPYALKHIIETGEGELFDAKKALLKEENIIMKSLCYQKETIDEGVFSKNTFESGVDDKDIRLMLNGDKSIIDRYPSTIYWTTLKKIGIINTSLSLSAFLKEIEAFIKNLPEKANKTKKNNGDDDGGITDDDIAESPVDLRGEYIKKVLPDFIPYDYDSKYASETLTLTRDEAEFLKNAFAKCDNNSLFSIVLNTQIKDFENLKGLEVEDDTLVSSFFNIVSKKIPNLSDEMKSAIKYAQYLNKLVPLINAAYNYVLLVNVHNDSVMKEEAINNWNDRINSAEEWIDDVSIDNIRDFILSKSEINYNHKAVSMCLDFFQSFIDLIKANKDIGNEYNEQYYKLFEERERKLKKGKSKFYFRGKTDFWKENSMLGIDYFRYRFNQPVKSFISDIMEGLSKNE